MAPAAMQIAMPIAVLPATVPSTAPMATPPSMPQISLLLMFVSSGRRGVIVEMAGAPASLPPSESGAKCDTDRDADHDIAERGTDCGANCDSDGDAGAECLAHTGKVRSS